MPVQLVDLATELLEQPMIVGLELSRFLLFQLAHFRLDRRPVDTGCGVVIVRVYTERRAERRQQVLFVHLRKALDRFVLEILGDIAQLLDRFVLELVCSLLLAGSPVCFEKEVRFVACSQRPGAMPIPSVRLGGAQATHGDGERLAISTKLDSASWE